MLSQDVVLKVTALSKRYRIGKRREIGSTILKKMADILSEPVHRFNEIKKLTKFRDHAVEEDVIWALKDVSFEVRKGDVLGIMGSNGAGKSTLLKILSRIISPTYGEFSYRGKLASLLEVGTGFNGDLTGRENIYLNGSILGMKKSEIDKVFDEIIDFSGVERFIDTPVKRYSSGMTVRLAFSVAAHLNPDILLLDEVLSVGDADFSKKSMKKMESVAKDGRTVILVSHSTTAVSNLCNRALYVGNGSVLASGSVEHITSLYLGATQHTQSSRVWSENFAPTSIGVVRILSVKIIDERFGHIDLIDVRMKFGVEISFEVLSPGYALVPAFQIVNSSNQVLFTSIENRSCWLEDERLPGLHSSIGWIEGNLLVEGEYSANILLFTAKSRILILQEDKVVTFKIYDPLEGGSSQSDYRGKIPGVIGPRLIWS